MQSAIDLFSGFGGWTTGGKAAGLDVLWAANHWPEAVEWHRANYPETQHVCQDLHQADWAQVPGHDLMLASPCSQGHTKARGLASANPKRDASRSTAWAPVGNAEVNRPDFDVLEKSRNSWAGLFTRLGYQLAPHRRLRRPRSATAPGALVHGYVTQQGAALAAVA
jgi:DNA (cytosine-5)-methyltransferase 1